MLTSIYTLYVLFFIYCHQPPLPQHHCHCHCQQYLLVALVLLNEEIQVSTKEQVLASKKLKSRT